MSYIAYTNSETSKVSIMQVLQGNVSEILATLPGDAFVLDASTLPADNYSDRWAISEGSVILTVDQATKDLRKDQLRVERQPLLEDLDRLFIEMKSQERDLDLIMARQKYLRDITEDPAFDTATTVEELDTITISEWTAPTASSLGICDFHRTSVTANTTLTYNQMMIGVNHSSPVTITLPEISGAVTTYIIKDESGDTSTNNITIVPSGSDTIENAANVVMNTNFQTTRLYSNGGALWLII